MSNEYKSCLCGCLSTFKKSSNTLDNNTRISTTTAKYQSIAAGNVDKRVALTVSPKTYQRDETLFADKVTRVLGEKRVSQSWIKSGSYFYGLLRNALGTSSGLIFPYTPSVSFSHQTNYNTVEIIHSNMTYNYYKNSPPPSIKIDSKFTADNRDNALHMLSAIWFLVACSKCEFGEKSAYAGLPPPVLYLNGYDHLMDNIPVVITGVSYSYPEAKHYVNLVLDFSQEYNHRGKEWKGGDLSFENDSFCKIYTGSTLSVSEKEKRYVQYDLGDDHLSRVAGEFESRVAPEYLDRVKSIEDVWKPVGGQSTSYKDNGIVYSFWLPTDIQIGITLAVQPNLIKTRKQWTLEGYKSGILLSNKGKNPPVMMPGKIGEEALSAINSFSLNTPENPGNDTSSQTCSTPCPCGDEREQLNFIPSGWTW